MAKVLILRHPEADLLPQDEPQLEAALRAAGATEVRFCDRESSGLEQSMQYVVLWVYEDPAGKVFDTIGEATLA